MSAGLATITPGECPDENAIAAFVEGVIDVAATSEVELHLDSCASCRQLVSELGRASFVANRPRAPLSGDTEVVVGEPAPVDPRPTPVVPAVGMVLAGKYRVERLLGSGGMGFVMAARHVSLGKLVALKLMHANVAVDPSSSQRFVREARAASRLHSEHIVRVIDLDTLADGSPYIAMEYLEGEDLGALLATRGRRPPDEVATYVVQVCEAIAEAHAAGIVHRDLKPANLFVTRRGDGSPCVKVLDFGVSKIIAGGPLADDLAATDTKALVGSPHYMAPEQLISAKAVDPRTDIWALGCILYELVIGRGPFDGTSLAMLLASILRDEPASLTTLRPDLPPGFVAVVERCLAKDPAQRFQSATELSAALVPFVPLAQATKPVRKPGERSTVHLAVALACGIAVAGAAVGFAVHRSRATPHDTEPAVATPAPIVTRAPVNPAPPQSAVTTVPAAPVSAPPPPAIAKPKPKPRVPAAQPAKKPLAQPPGLEDDLLAPELPKQ